VFCNGEKKLLVLFSFFLTALILMTADCIDKESAQAEETLVKRILAEEALAEEAMAEHTAEGSQHADVVYLGGGDYKVFLLSSVNEFYAQLRIPFIAIFQQN
jgi:predicted amidohydrolase YtcJ